MGTNITRRFEFDAGHRILNHESKCKHLHGHRYAAEVTVATKELDNIGRVVDFGEMKDQIGNWIDSNWDHNLILNPEDPLIKMWRSIYGTNTGDEPQTHEWRGWVFGGKEPFIMPVGVNPTAENMARVLFNAVKSMLWGRQGLHVVRVRLYETPNCWADYSEG